MNKEHELHEYANVTNEDRNGKIDVISKFFKKEAKKKIMEPQDFIHPV